MYLYAQKEQPTEKQITMKGRDLTIDLAICPFQYM